MLPVIYIIFSIILCSIFITIIKLLAIKTLLEWFYFIQLTLLDLNCYLFVCPLLRYCFDRNGPPGHYLSNIHGICQTLPPSLSMMTFTIRDND